MDGSRRAGGTREGGTLGGKRSLVLDSVRFGRLRGLNLTMTTKLRCGS